MNNNKYKILLVEAEQEEQARITELLEENGYRIIAADDADSAKMLHLSHVPDLMLLDPDLPDQDGSVLLEELRREDATPVIILSSHTEEAETVRFLDLGANDYIKKPCGDAELLARIRSTLRDCRSRSSGATSSELFALGELEIRYGSRRVFLGGREIKLTQTEYNVLALLSQNADCVLSYATIIKEIWREYPTQSNIKRLQVNVANLRKKLGELPGSEGYIVNEAGVGYRMGDAK
ncbi:MAG: response regulator transcription factor [Clostridia bacterium]|nr:response regulator transcription factor [Clostridia bacterium]